MDRFIYSSHASKFSGESLRKKQKKLQSVLNLYLRIVGQFLEWTMLVI